MKQAKLMFIFATAGLLLACGESQTQSQPVVNEAGQSIWQANCAVCHQNGLAGSPPIGNKKMWAPRIAKGLPTLFEHAKHGFSGETGEMPPRGGNANLTDTEIELAVTYMVESSQ